MDGQFSLSFMTKASHMFIPDTTIDTLYDYKALLTQKSLCQLPNNSLGKEVAIVGGGAAGLLAAHELLKMGLSPVIYEYESHLGGRLYSKPFLQTFDDVPPFAELGAMRIPSCSHVFLHYAKELNLTCSPSFPSPGKVESTIYYQKKLYSWLPNHPAPGPFRRTEKLWDRFITPYIETIHQQWQKGNIEAVKAIWQSYIDTFKDKSLYEVLTQQSSLGLPENIDHFGSLGFGSFGFQPFFQISFLEILRVMINPFFDKHNMVMEGANQFVDRLYHKKIHTDSGAFTSLAEQGCAQFKITVIAIDFNLETQNPIIVYRNEREEVFEKEFSAVIYTGSTSAAQLLGLTSKARSGIYLFNEQIRDALKKSPMFYSSKTYICTESKFWKKLKIPACIMTDEITKNTFFLDYPFTKRGVVCLSYTLGLDALKLTAVEPHHRVIIFKRIMEEISSVTNNEISPLNNEVISIDWVNQKFQNGAFKISVPGTSKFQQALYYQFQHVLTPKDKGVYLAGDGISWSSGWVESALTTGLNAVYAVAKRLGATIHSQSPLSQNPDLFSY